MDRRTGAERIADERRRQIDDEGYDRDHDLGVGAAQLTDAAIAYALVSEFPGDAKVHDRTMATWWPWGAGQFKATGDRVRDLEKAGALIAAAIDVALALRVEPTFDTVPDPGIEYEDRFETASDGGEM